MLAFPKEVFWFVVDFWSLYFESVFLRYRDSQISVDLLSLKVWYARKGLFLFVFSSLINEISVKWLDFPILTLSAFMLVPVC